MSAWDDEYVRAGIPSSYRDEPSSVVLWAIDCWPRITGGEALPRRGLDVGCGTARNTAYLIGLGVEMIAFDSSPVAIGAARARVEKLGDARASVLVHDLRDGLPAGDGTIDLALDVFVYKHQVEPEARRRYRAELLRVLAPAGRVLLSLAEPEDGYYGQCPPSPAAGAGPRAVVDPVTGAGSVLFTLEELAAEMGDGFELELAWRRAKPGSMHGARYVRRTLATIWRAG